MALMLDGARDALLRGPSQYWGAAYEGGRIPTSHGHRTFDAARAKLDALAFEMKELHVVLRRRAAALAAERCPAHESDRIRRRLLAEEEPSVVAAALEALDARADERGVREWLGDFAGWRRPVAGEP